MYAYYGDNILNVSPINLTQSEFPFCYLYFSFVGLRSVRKQKRNKRI